MKRWTLSLTALALLGLFAGRLLAADDPKPKDDDKPADAKKTTDDKIAEAKKAGDDAKSAADDATKRGDSAWMLVSPTVAVYHWSVCWMRTSASASARVAASGSGAAATESPDSRRSGRCIGSG